MDTLIIPNMNYLEHQFGCFEVFLSGTGTLHNQFMKGNVAGTNVKMAATIITKSLERFYKKSDEVHPHILRFTNLLTDTIFSVRPEFLTKNPDKIFIKSDEKDAKDFIKTAKPMFDKEERNNLNKLISKLRGMVVKHKECIYNMEKESKTFHSLHEKIQWREESVRQRITESNKDISEQDKEYALLNDFTLKFHKQAFRILGFEALKRRAKTMDKKVQIEKEMKQLENKILTAIETPMKQRLAEAMTKLIRMHELKCFSPTSVNDIHHNMIKLADNIGKVVFDLTETNSTRYNFIPSFEGIAKFRFMRIIRNMDKFLMGNTNEDIQLEIPKFETKHYGLQAADLGEYIKKSSIYINSKTIKIHQQNNQTKSKEIVKQMLCKDNIVFGWTKASTFFSKKKYGFYVLNNAVSR